MRKFIMPITFKNIDQLEQDIVKKDGAGLILLVKADKTNDYLVYVRNRPGVQKVRDKNNKDVITSTFLEDRPMTGIGGKFTGIADDDKTPETRAERIRAELQEETFGAFKDIEYKFVTDDEGKALCHEVINADYSYTTAIATAIMGEVEFKEKLVAIDKNNRLLYPFGDFLINKMTFDAYKTTDGPAYSRPQAVSDAQKLMMDYDNAIESAKTSGTPFLQLLPAYIDKEMRRIANGTSDLLNELDKPAGVHTRRGLSFADGLLLLQASWGATWGELMCVTEPLSDYTEANRSGFAYLSTFQEAKGDIYCPDMNGEFSTPTFPNKGIWWNDDATKALVVEFIKLKHPEMLSNRTSQAPTQGM